MATKKQREPIPSELAARVLFASDRTCCVCRAPGKPVQIHHIDDDPSHNDPANLAVLCFDCHRDTQIRGGFDRKLDADQVTLYRDDWVRKVAEQRASSAMQIDSDTSAEHRLELATTIAEIHRDKRDHVSLAAHYSAIGNKELRDKYVELALKEGVDDALVFFLRGSIQQRGDLIPKDVARRELSKRAKLRDWTQRARRLVALGRHDEAVRDYLRGIQRSLNDKNYFSAAYYLKELTEEGLIEELFILALKEAAEEDNLWWQVRSLQELGWTDELRELVLANSERIRQEQRLSLLELLAWAEGDWNEYVRMRKLEAEGEVYVQGGYVWKPRTITETPEDS